MTDVPKALPSYVTTAMLLEPSMVMPDSASAPAVKKSAPTKPATKPSSEPAVAPAEQTVTVAAVASEGQSFDPSAYDDSWLQKLMVLFGSLLASGGFISWYTRRRRALASELPPAQEPKRTSKATQKTSTAERSVTSLHEVHAQAKQAEQAPETESAAEPEKAEVIPEEIKAAAAQVDDDAITTKLDLANTYLSMGEVDTAQELLQEVIAKGNAHHQHLAKTMLDKIERNQ